MDSKEMLSPYAAVALFAKEEFQKVEARLKYETNSRNIAILTEQCSGLRHLIDRCFRESGVFIPAHVSKCASQYCSENQLGDVFAIPWRKQTKFEKQPNRKSCMLKHEHKIPVSMLVEEMRFAKTLKEALGIFNKQEIVWVHKGEDGKLPRNKRPNSDELYAKAGIEIIKNTNPIGHLFK